VYCAASREVTDLKLRWVVGGVQPVVGMGMVRWNIVGLGVEVAEGFGQSDKSGVEELEFEFG
jgi:hypothetical protein